MTVSMPDKNSLLSANDIAEAKEFLPEIFKWNVVTQQDMEFAGKLLAEVKDRAKELKAKRDSVTKPLQEIVKTIQSWFKEPLDSLSQCEMQLKQKISLAIEAVDAARKEAVRKAEIAAAAGDLCAVKGALAEANAQGFDPVAGLSSRKLLDYKVVDFAKVPRVYLMLDDRSIKEALRAGTAIPGLEIVYKTSVASRSTLDP